ncbi:hypothetical protein BDF19DRAFT_81785 [Syncephalis fuscata]|nr:hypothetical protein BDF19DRAFT_81785 [Syncephalis fuscata]
MMSLQTMAFAMVSLVSILMSIMPSANGLLRVVSDASSSAKTLSQIPSHDLYARENIIKSLRAILVSARFVPAKSCELADVLAPPTTNSAAVDAINATMLFVHWPDAVKAGCYTFNQVILQRDQTKAAFDNAKLPAMGGFCFSAPSVAKGASNAFGGPYDPMGPLKQNYTDFYTVVPFEVADSLRTMSNGTIPLIVDALQGLYILVHHLFFVITIACREWAVE